MKIAIVLGTRPEILKNYSTVKALKKRGLEFEVLWTGQHHDPRLHEPFFRSLGYAPTSELMDYRLGRAVDWVSDQLVARSVDLVLVNGDTAAALVGALAGLYTDRRIAHVEAGLRSGDPLMYEERNRIMVDSVAHYLFAYTAREKDLLESRTEYRGQVHLVGNTTVDLIQDVYDRLARPAGSDNFAFVTLHRKEFTDRKDRMERVFDALNTLADHLEVRFPVHPRTLDAAHRAGLDLNRWPKVCWMEPFGPFDALAHIRHAAVVLTDSGCVQEEAAILKTPCVTVRENTERPLTVEAGINVLAGFDPKPIVDAALRQWAADLAFPNIYGTPGVADRILDVLLKRVDA